jgi:DNA-binding GntR family transcriptional regulator
MKQTASEKAYQEIKDRIVKISLRPGSVIDEANLMQELDLGRTPIREALKQLQAENLITVTPRRGMYVADIAITDLVQIHEVRIEVEANCARLAAQRISRQQLQEIKEMICKEQEVDKYNMEDLIILDRRFHSLIAKAADNRFLYKDWEYYYNLSLRIWYLILNYLQPEDVGIEDHNDLLEAIEKGDIQNADTHMRHHIVHFYETVKRAL